ncbi:MAG TPA: hypothetical protein VJK51_01695 [Candidatus Nanoarchaeia archaeon]|nr:hypothetical protein [Candidatus Nanoarchaeia archaeon]
MKPNKTPYKNQKKIHDLILSELKKSYLNNIKEAYVIGSLVNGNFGVYDEEYEGYKGSDIDVVIITEKINKAWKYEGDFYDWHKAYLAGEIKIEKTRHPIKLLIPINNDIQLFFNKAKELNWKIEKLK